MEVKELWLQELVKNGRIKLNKIRGDSNPADVMTKYLDRTSCVELLLLGNLRVVTAEVSDRAEGGC